MNTVFQPLVSLLRSRKFWIGVISLVLPQVLVALGVVDPNLAESIQTIALALIGAITVEDAAAKLNGQHPSQQ